jgi:hypothetical protein
MTNWVIGQTNRFAAAVAMRSISNLVSEYSQHDIVIWGARELGPPPYPDLDELWRRSPIRYVQDITTPLLLTCGEMDLRCAISQSEEMFGAMRLLGKTVELVRFPEESHDISRSGRPDRRVERLRRIAGWFERFLGTEASDHPTGTQATTQTLGTRKLASIAEVEEPPPPSPVAEPVAAELQSVESEVDPEAIVLAPDVEQEPAALAPEPEPVAPQEVAAEEAVAPAAEPVEEWQATVPPAAEAAEHVEEWQATVPPAAEAAEPIDAWQETVPPAPEPAEPVEAWQATVPPAPEPAQPAEAWQASVPPAAEADVEPVFPAPEPLIPQPAEAAPEPVATATEPEAVPEAPAPAPPEPEEVAAAAPAAPGRPDPVAQTVIAWPHGAPDESPSNGSPAQSETSEEATSIIPAWQPSDVPDSKQTVSLQAVPPEVIEAGGGYPAKLTFESGPFAGRIVAVPNQMVTVGRAPDNDIVVSDPATSGRHGRIEVRGGAFWISDLGSTNGTLVNGEPVIEKQLGHGDLIAIGQNTIRFTLES